MATSSSRSGSRTDPRLGERVQIGPAALPRARRRDPDEVEEHAWRRRQAAPGDGVELLAGELPVLLERRPHPHRGRLDGGRVITHAVRAQPPLAARPADRPAQRPVVAGRHEVDRRAHQRGLDDPPPLEVGREVAPPEAARRDQQPTYIVGAYCDCRPATASSIDGMSIAARATSSCRAITARRRSSDVSTGSPADLDTVGQRNGAVSDVARAAPGRGSSPADRPRRHRAPGSGRGRGAATAARSTRTARRRGGPRGA